MAIGIRLLVGFVVFMRLAFTEAVAEDDVPIYREHQDLSYYIDSNGTKQKIRTVADWSRRRTHILHHMQTVMGKLPRPKRPVPLDMKVLETVHEDGYIRKKISYCTDSQSRRVRAYLMIPAPGATKKKTQYPAMLCLHQTVAIGKKEPVGLGGEANLHYALHLVKRGFVTLSPDYPSFGEYDYDFDPKDGYVSGTMKAIYDNIRAVDLMQTLAEVDAKRIGCIGHSLGGHNAIFTAAFEPRIKVIVSSCGFTRFHKYYEGNLKGWTSKRYMPLIASKYDNVPDRVPFDFTEIVGCLAPRPFFVNAPLKDHNFDVSGVRDVFRSASPIYKLLGKSNNFRVVHPDCGHDFPVAIREKAYRFLAKHLKQ